MSFLGVRALADRTAFLERAALALAQLGLAPAPFPAPLFDAYFGAVAARAISAAGELGVFNALAESPDDASGLARRTELTDEGADALLVALNTLGLVRFRRGRFALTRNARRWTVERTPTWTGAFGRWAYDTASGLTEALRGEPPRGLHDRPADDPFWKTYQDAMAELAPLSAETVAALIPVEAPRRLLDLAGGPGLHAEALVRRHPGLEATVVELAGAARHASASSIHYLEGDLFAVELGVGYDIVTAHNILHNLPRDRCLALLRRAHDALRPGGTLAVLELERPPRGRPGTRAATIGSLLFLVASGTRTWTAAELEELARSAGLVETQLKRPPQLNGSVVVLAKRP